jgi:8-oxo-dGTP pyrophosphatase MutT (NUDIX family)
MGRRRIQLPPGWARWAGEHAGGGRPAAAPRDAATVALVRQAPGGPGGLGGPGGPGSPGGPGVEAFLLRRTRALEFAPGVCVFPGGSVDPHDADPAVGWAGPPPAELAGWLGTSAEHARALVCAAVRETFEESGVLLAGPSAEVLLDDGAALARDRRALLDGSVSLAGLLGRRGLVVRADLLRPWARWITPEVSPRRFDTWFFVAALPAGQAATPAAEGDPVPGESESGAWLRPAAALDAARAGEITLLPPTAVTLSELAGHRDLAGLLAARRTIAPLMPEVLMEDGQAWLAMPQAVEYPL